MTRQLPSISYLRACFGLDPDTGVLLWKARPREHFTTQGVYSAFTVNFAGTAAGTQTSRCVSVKLDGIAYKAHRIVWALVHGEWPSGQIDHADGNPQNNAVANLRPATNQQNQFNSKLSRANRSGFKGVCWDKPRGLWRAQLCHNGKSVFLGHYSTPEEAAAAYAEGAKRYAKEFARPV